MSQLLAVRNLSTLYFKYRQDHKLRKNRFGYSLLKVEEEGGYVPGPPVEMKPIGAQPLDWQSQVAAAKEDMTRIREKLALLQKTQQRRLLKVFDDASGAETLADAEIDGMGQEITRIFRSCESRIKRLVNGDAVDEREMELRRNAQRALAQSLQKLNEDTRTVQKGFMREVRRRQKMSGFEDSETTAGSSLLDGAFTDAQASAIESLEAEAEQRSEEINKIAKSVVELNRLFKELAGLVIDQGTILDRIDYNIENVQENTKQATVQLQRAEEQQRSGSAMKCIFILIALIFLNLFILSIK